ncbi:predicted protein [Lodderomyces elongisporus NRRL YB-4239]|uniref:Splicing factor subunit n=1 Tax=Lodderomyces elongisporus (strain ATCC 11503 / CBS 2605 / JCM 1781 / NBRC 1676 / NRRL YB-4239) TaxID=379508 RepID=A5DSL9_LODEL|nr:predicted protein [Lodderomyces elongisporus NRRL YB-4239]
MADKIREKHQYALLKSKYDGIGNSDTTSKEFQTTIYNDTFASLAHHKHLLLHNAVIRNEHPELVRQEYLKKLKPMPVEDK